ncbi:nitrite reductase small subunit NirD [Erwinia sp.]|uniref:nitrite reductase small subunit NirD n=1 Tax=Erwinia citreus TaxID=558 RepID=UPI003C76AF53
MSHWYTVCSLDSILPATGVCALVNNQQLAIFRPRADETVYALSNIDPFAQASVLSRGLTCEHQLELWVASPLKKQRFRLRDGLCMEDESRSVASYQARVRNGQVEIAV